jgi:hypothetical protein
MTTKPHHAHIYYTVEEYVSAQCNAAVEAGLDRARVERRTRKKWKKHIEKNGNVPLLIQCGVCSGKEHKTDIKLGRWKLSTRTEQNDKKNISDNEKIEE